jgi:hypothetical protein
MARLWVVLTAVAATLTVLLSIARWIGGLDGPPVSLAMLETGACSQPCWHGVKPGKTSLDQVAELAYSQSRENYNSAQMLYANEYCWKIPSERTWHGCVRRNWASNPGTPIESLELEPPDGALRLGDTFRVFGEPVAAESCQSSPGLSNSKIVAQLYFRDHIIVTVSHPFQPDNTRLSPAMAVRWMYYYAPTASGYVEGIPSWRGFSTQLAVDYC